MDVVNGDRSMLEWDEGEVQNWLSALGYPQYESQIKVHKISGEVLCMMDAVSLKALGVSTIGQRLAILKAIYLIKLAQGIPVAAHHYVPPSENPDQLENVSISKLHSMIQTQAQRLRNLEEENKNLGNTMQTILDEFNGMQASLGQEDNPLRRQPSFKWAQFVKPAKSPTKPDTIESPHPSPQQLEHDIPSYSTRPPGPSLIPAPSTSTSDKPRPQPTVTDSPNTSQPAVKPHRQESSDNLKSFKVSLEDPTWKVLPAALKKYRINNDSWQNYAMFICYGSTGNRIERCLSYDEKPLLLFQKLKDAKKNPVFMLKHIKDIRSPIVVAQQKHAARKASSIMTTESTSASHGHTKNPSTSRTINRPPRLEVQDLSSSAPLPSGVLSPSVEHGQRIEDGNPPPGSAGASQASSVTIVGSTTSGQDSAKSRGTTSSEPSDQSLGSGTSAREIPVPSAGVSYAVAIYPYMAEQEDEFDVVVGDTFVILSRARGWWVVQRDPTGSGIVDTDIVKQGWVPAGCLLETNVPVASAIAEATAAKAPTSGSPAETPVSKTPILPLSIISTSFPGVALMDYKKKGDEELDLVKDDALRVFKRYNHWSYAVKESGGDRGWVPSWFIGKVAPVGNPPPTPSTSTAPPQPISSVSLDDSGQAQVSPMSSAFPPVQTRGTPVI
ncbi:hypothetical protein BD779DRAFT_1521192 [Infundibulicybe gibba]|nr:hypothetical protein BD779DRAFT_1521192 [Infundibulicybe gibba]